MNCIDIAPDPVWIGKDNLLTCLSPDQCRSAGCYWRKFHMLPAGKFAPPRQTALALGPGDDDEGDEDEDGEESPPPASRALARAAKGYKPRGSVRRIRV